MMITRASSADVSLWSDLNIFKREVYQLTIYKGRHYVNRKHTRLLALYTNQSESSFTFSLFNQPIRRESQNLAFYMRPGKELYQAHLHSRHYQSNPGEWRKGPDLTWVSVFIFLVFRYTWQVAGGGGWREDEKNKAWHNCWHGCMPPT